MSNQIEADNSVSKDRHTSRFKEINSNTKARRVVVNIAEPEMIVLRVRF